MFFQRHRRLAIEVSAAAASGKLSNFSALQLCLGVRIIAAIRIGPRLIFPIRSPVSAIGFNLFPNFVVLSEEVALRSRMTLDMHIPSTCRSRPRRPNDALGFHHVQAKEKHGVKGKIIAFVLRKKSGNDGQSEHRGRYVPFALRRAPTGQACHHRV